jgi:uncharacterized RDD family membrane protein YckC
MSTVTPGWYKDPAEPTTQRYWDGEGWVGGSLPLDATPPDGPMTATPAQHQDPGVRAAPAPPASPGTVASPGNTPTTGATPQGSPAPGQVPPQPGAWPPYPQGSFPPGMFPPGTIPGGRLPPNWPPGVPFPGGPYVLRPIPRPHGLALAPLGLRFLARLIDIASVLLLNVLLNGWLVYQWIQETTPYWKGLWNAAQNKESFNGNMSTRGTTLLIVITLLAIAIWLAYEVPFIGNYGQTLGKRIMGIRVVPLEGLHRLGYGRATRRWMALGMPMIFWMCNPAFILIGFVFQLMDCISPVLNRPLHLALHDRSAGTVVVEAGSHDTAVAAKTPAQDTEPTDGGTR